GALYGRDGKMEKAIEHLKKGYGPDKYDDHNHQYAEIAKIYENNNDWKKALEWRKKALEAYPDKVEYMDYLAWTYVKLNMDDEAAQLYLKVIEQTPDAKNRGAYMVLTARYYKNGNREKAYKYLLQGMKLNPNDYYFPFTLGRFHYLNKEYLQSEKYFMIALSFKADDEFLLHALGTLYLVSDELSDRKKGKKYLLKVIEINPDCLEAHQNLTKIFEEEQNDKKAEYHREREREIKIKQLFR
ncbi:MAG: hypothetical protein ABI855_14380, partial [Bacteroidota bacterium]